MALLLHIGLLAAASGEAAANGSIPVFGPLEHYSKEATVILAGVIELSAAVVIGVAAIQATVKALLLFVRSAPGQSKEGIRLELGRWLAVALEFELGADILRTAIAPTWNEIGQLAAIVVLRTALNYFLQQEIDKATARGHDVPA